MTENKQITLSSMFTARLFSHCEIGAPHTATAKIAIKVNKELLNIVVESQSRRLGELGYSLRTRQDRDYKISLYRNWACPTWINKARWLTKWGRTNTAHEWNSRKDSGRTAHEKGSRNEHGPRYQIWDEKYIFLAWIQLQPPRWCIHSVGSPSSEGSGWTAAFEPASLATPGLRMPSGSGWQPWVAKALFCWTKNE